VRILLTVLLAGCAVQAPKEPGFPLQAALDSAFRTIKPELHTVRLVSLRVSPLWIDTAAYAVIASALGPQRGMDSLGQGGEIFGVFMVDSAFTRITRTLDYFRAPISGGYDVWIAGITGDSIIVCGRGVMYGTPNERRTFPLEYPQDPPIPPPPGPSLEEADGVGSLPPDCRFR
jgi:hypothetical protein